MSFLVTMFLLLNLATAGDLPSGSTMAAATTPTVASLRPAINPITETVVTLKGEVTTTTSDASLIEQLALGVKALEMKGLALSPTRRTAIATAALTASKATGVDPFLLVALARMESDFVAVARTAYQCKLTPKFICSADCGITQHHVNGKGTWVIKYCNVLQRDMVLSFTKSAEELAHHVEWCQNHSSSGWYSPLEQCVLNRYNQGPYYRRDSDCTVKDGLGMDRENLSNLRRKCLIRAAYWKRVLCFYHGVRTGAPLQRSCRYCMSVDSIPWYYNKPTTVAYAVPPLFKALADKATAAQTKTTTPPATAGPTTPTFSPAAPTN